LWLTKKGKKLIGKLHAPGGKGSHFVTLHLATKEGSTILAKAHWLPERLSFPLKREKIEKKEYSWICGSVSEKHKLITATVLLNIPCLPRKDSAVSVKQK